MRLRAFIPTSGKVRAGLLIVLVFAVIAVVGPLLTDYGPRSSGPNILQPPSAEHWLGTTQTGQDVYAQFVYGARVSLAIGLFAGVVSQVFSILVGVIGGYFRGVTDDLMYILTAVFLVMPSMPLLIVLTGYLPSRGMVSVAIVIAITSWAGSARSLRAQTMSLRNRDFVEAARATGESRVRIITSEILPNALPLVASGFLFSVIAAILAEAGLSFLGLGSLTTTSWGSMLYFAQNAQAFLIGAWWWFVPPGLAIATIGAGLALINFGIDEYSNPRLRTGKSRSRTQQHGPRAATLSSVGAAATSAADETNAAPSVRLDQGAPAQAENERPATDGLDEPPQIRTADHAGDPVIEVRDVVVEYPTTEGVVRAVDEVSLTLRRGEILGLAGESGSGKSTLTNAMTRLLRSPGQVTQGSITYHRDGTEVDLLTMDAEELRRYRWEELAIVFQSAMNCLNPVMSVKDQFDDVIRAHRPGMSAQDRAALASEMMAKVDLEPDRLTAYPHELSGGMRQRVVIAIALVLQPDVLVLDEPTTALDLLVQREVLEQVLELREQFGFAIIFTTHDLALLLEMCDSIAIMRRGVLVEYGSSTDVYQDPRHSYTRTLLQSLSDLGAAV